ncbi:MAG: FecR domain-containing protein [bacterium]
MRTYHHNGIMPYVWIPVMLAVTLLAVSLTCNALTSESPVGMIDEVLGTVYLQHAWEGTPSIARADEEVFPKDRIRTDVNAKAHIIFVTGASLDIGGGTDLEIKEFLYRPSDSLTTSRFQMRLGRLRALVSRFTNPESRFEIETTTAVTGVVGTEQLVINERSRMGGDQKDVTRAICTRGRVWVGSVAADIPGRVVLEPFTQVLVYVDEPPAEVRDIGREEIDELLRGILVSVEQEHGDAIGGHADPERTGRGKGQKGPAVSGVPALDTASSPQGPPRGIEGVTPFTNPAPSHGVNIQREKRPDEGGGIFSADQLLDPEEDTPGAEPEEDAAGVKAGRVKDFEESPGVFTAEELKAIEEASGIHEKGMHDLFEEIPHGLPGTGSLGDREGLHKEPIMDLHDLNNTLKGAADELEREIGGALEMDREILPRDDVLNDLTIDNGMEDILTEIERMPQDIHQEEIERFQRGQRDEIIRDQKEEIIEDIMQDAVLEQVAP